MNERVTWRRPCAHFILAIFLTSSLVASNKAAAQQTYAEVLDRYGGVIETQIPKIRDLIRPNMTAAEREIDKRVRFRVIRDDVNNAAAFIDRDTGRRIIEIHVGLIRAMDAITSARAYALTTGDHAVPGKWLDYVAEEINQRQADPMRARDFGVIQSFQTFVGMDEVTWRRMRTTPAVEQLFDIEMNSSLMWLIGHELGHHFHNHQRQRNVDLSRKQEEQADEVARRLMRGTEYSPYFTVPVLLAFAVWEPEAHLYESARTHPAPITRLEHNLREGAKQLLEDPEFSRYLRESGQEATFREQVEADMQALRALRLPNWAAD